MFFKKLKYLFFLLLITNCSSLFAQSRLDVIAIDAGHGGKDPGTIGDKTGVFEKNIVLPIALKLGALIEKNYPAIRIIYLRKTDEFIELTERTGIANDNKAKLFISIHANHKKQEESDKNGFEIYLLSKERFGEAVLVTMKNNHLINFTQNGKDTIDNYIFSSLAQNGYYRFNEFLANKIEISMLDHTQLESRGVYQAGFWVIVGTSMPSVLVETGYLSDLNNEMYLSSDKGQTDIAIGLYNAFLNYKMLYESQ
jgi:N-acetylmuramoyl-L-alanine amidase